MPKIPIVKAQKLIKVLKKKGYFHQRTTGSHYIFVRNEDRSTISVPVHAGHDLGRGITLQILKDADISVEEFLKLG
ncbi:type II toxin-antitoxin system HicA family toxin [Candidatus Gottesmanbacteria bacterium]|nr:type II toxin-antitoxin system HicA family toxin [Candidatus Gottesmanbacteria bacterium]